MKVIIVGAGIVGLTSAWYLHKAGYHVTLLEKESAATMREKSESGLFSIPHTQPFNHPGIFTKFWQGFAASAPAFKIRADFSIHQTRWGIEALKQSSAENYAQNRFRLFNLAKLSRGALYEILAEHEITFTHQQSGALQICENEAALSAAATQKALLKQHEIEATLLTPEEVVEHEPALKSATKPIAGGLLFNNEEIGDSQQLCAALTKILQGFGVEFIYNCEVERILTEESSGQIRAITSGEYFYQADQYLFTTGAKNPTLFKDLFPLPIYPVKGYRLIYPLSPSLETLRSALVDPKQNITLTRLKDRLYVSGYHGIEGFNATQNPREITPLKEMVRAWLPHIETQEPLEQRLFFRPTTPDGTPIISATQSPNLFLNMGHGDFKAMLSSGSAKLIAEIMQARPTSLNSYDYALSRRL